MKKLNQYWKMVKDNPKTIMAIIVVIIVIYSLVK